MVEYTRRDVVCLHLAARADAAGRSPAPRAVTAAGIADALELGDTAGDRVQLLRDLEGLQEAGLVRSEDRPVEGFDEPRRVYLLTGEGHRRARVVRERVRDETVVLTNGTTEEVRLGEVGRFLETDAAPLVTALARLTGDGEVPLDRHGGEGFVDRTDELASVVDAIETSFTRESRTAVVAGPAGMGKTALVRAAVDDVAGRHDDLVVATGDCHPDATDPYAPFQRAFDAIPDRNDVREALETARREDAPDDAGGGRARRTALFRDVGDAVRSAATDRPLVVVLENLQWADDATLELLAHLATNVDEMVYRVAFVGTYRSPAVASADAHSLPATLERIREYGTATEVDLEPLSRAHTRELVATVLGRYRLPDAFLDLVHERTGGNPLFVRETAMHLLETDAVDPQAGRYPTDPGAVDLPREVTAQAGRRLEVLDDAGRALLGQAAVLGERIPGEVLATASDLPPGERREYADLLVASHIWTPVGGEATGSGDGPDAVSADGSGALRFVSGALREAVVDRLPDAAVRRYHRRAAEAFLAVHGGDTDAHAARVAHHYDAAGEAAAAVEHYRRAGDYASDTYAYEDAVDHYERAVALADDDDATGDRERAALRSTLAETLQYVSGFERALEVTRAGLADAPERSRLRCRLLDARAGALLERSAFDRAAETAREQREVARELGAEDLVATATQQLGLVAEHRGAYDRARERYEEALEVAREVGDRAREATALDGLGMAAHRQDEYDRAREHLRRSLEVRQDLGQRFHESATRNNLGLVAMSRGEYDRAREQFEAALDIERDLGDRRGEAVSAHNLGEAAHDLGAYDEAREYYERSLAIERDLGNRKGAAITRRYLGDVARDRGDHDRAREQYEAALAVARELDLARTRAACLRGLGALARAAGDRERARTRLDRSAELFGEMGSTTGAAKVRLQLAELDLSRGDPDAARGRVERALEAFDEVGMPLGAARARRLLGRVAAAAGAPEVAREHWRQALATFEAVGASQGTLETLRHLVGACREADDDGRAREWVRRARSVRADAPAATAETHAGWVARAVDEFDGLGD